MPLHYNWRKIYIREEDELFKLLRTLKDKWTPNIISIDTETTGLNPVEDKAFYLSLAFVFGEEAVGVGVYYKNIHPNLVKDLITRLYELTTEGFILMHNAPFDMNMLHNAGVPAKHKNIIDTQTLIRLCTKAVPVKAGGAPLKLKQYAVRYLDKKATEFEKLLKKEKTAIARNYNKSLKLSRSSLLILDTFPNDITDLPECEQELYLKWYEQLPASIKFNMTKNIVCSDDVPYDLIPEKVLSTYGVYDAIYTYEIFEELYPLVDPLEVRETLEQEIALVYPLYRIIREGFYIDKDYILDSRRKLKGYLKKRIADMKRLTGKAITHSQHAELKKVLIEKYGLEELESTNEETLTLKSEELKKDPKNSKVVELIDTVLELRTLSKWYTTYLDKFYKASLKGSKVYSSLNPAGAVTGRFTSDFQQFPKGAIEDNEGNVLFVPRKMIIPGKDELMLFVDYSQIELRIQAMYTIMLGFPDFNLCRAYLPFKCIHYLTGEEYDYQKQTHIARWNERQRDGNSVWLTEEENTPWKPTDLHSKTTENSYPDVPTNSKDFKRLRNEIGKRANFACNYGAKTARLFTMFPNVTYEEAERIYQGYRTTFPGVIQYQRWCYTIVNEQGYGENMFGRKYYGINGHHLANAAVQGTGADLLKKKMIELFYLLEEKYKTKMLFSVHDEIIFRLDPNEGFLIPKIVEIMEHLPKTVVPIVAESELTDSNWYEKKGYLIEEDGKIKIKGEQV